MRTTISLDDQLARRVKERAAAAGMSVSAFIAQALRDVLTRAQAEPEVPPFRLVTAGEGEPRPDVDLDRTSALLAAEDAARYGPRGD